MPKKNPDQKSFDIFIQTEPSNFLNDKGKKKQIKNRHPLSSIKRKENSRATPKQESVIVNPWWNN